MNKGTWVVFGVFILLFSACKKPASRNNVEVVNAPLADSSHVQVATLPVVQPKKELPIEKKIDWITIEKPSFEFLKFRSRVEFNSPTLSQDFPVNFQIKKDSIIWISISVGLEVARGIIRQDSIIFIDRLNRHVYRFDFASLSSEIGFPLNYGLVQSLIIGDVLIPQRPEDDVVRQNNQAVLKQNVEGLALESFIDTVLNKLIRLEGFQQATKESLELIVPRFQETPAGIFPALVQVKIENAEKSQTPTRITMEHQRVEVVSTELRFPFNVPRNYTEKQLKP